MQEIESVLKETSTENWQVIFYDDYSEVPYTIETFPSKDAAETWADGHEYTYNDEWYNPVTSDYEFKDWHKFHNPEDKESYNGYDVKQVNSKTLKTEGPEERLGAYRRLVITSTKIPALKAEFTKFTARPEIKADFPVKMTFFDSPKPNVLVVDLNGDNATVLATKFSDIIKRTDAAAEILVRKEKKLK